MKTLIFIIAFIVSCYWLKAQKFTKQAEWQQKVNFEIKVTLKPASKMLQAEMTVHYYNNSPDTLKSIWLHVWPNAYSNTQTAYALQELKNLNTDFQFSNEKEKGYIKGFNFTTKEDTLKWHFDSLNIDILEVILHTPLLPHTELIFSTPFSVKLPKIFSRSGAEDDFFAITQWYPKPAVYDVNGWNTMPYLNQGEFYSEFGDYKVTISLPKKYKVASTGNKVEETYKKNGDTVEFINYTYEEHNIHDFAWFASSGFLIQHRAISLGNGDSVHLNYFEHSKDLPSLKKSRENSNMTLPIERGILEYSKRVGNYPYKNCTVVIGKLIAGGGMEYPTITVCSSPSDETIIHEVGHNWFYGMLGNNERRYPWMDESINTFFEQKIIGRLAGDSLFYKKLKGKSWLQNYSTLLVYLFSARQGISQPLNLTSEAFTNLNYGSIVYAKGPLLFAYLEQQLGDSIFSKCIKNYFKEWQFRHPLPKDMQNSFEQTSGEKLDWFFIDLMNENNETDIIKNNTEYEVKGSAKLDSILRQKKFENANTFGFLPETNYKNNGQKLKLITVAFPLQLPKYNSRMQVNITPIAGYNYYDKLYIGAAFYNRSLFRNKCEYTLIPAYAIGTKKMVGYGKLNYLIFFKNKHLFKTETGIQGQTFGIDINSQLNHYYRINPYINIHFKHKGIINEMIDKQLQLNYYHTGLQNANYLAYQDSNKTDVYLNFPSSYFFNYYRIAYLLENKHPINSFGLKLSSEYGYNYKFTPQSSQYIKTWVNASYKYTYGNKNKFYKTELFAGVFLNKKGTTNRQQFYLSGNSGAKDYTYNDALIGRSENTLDDNILGRQIINTNGNMRNTIPYASTDKWMIALNNELCLPGIIPIRLYADFGYYPYLKSITTNTGTITELIKAEVYTTAGIILPLFKETLEIFIPLYRSKQFLTYSNYNYSIGNSIGFKLNLNKLSPFKLIDNYRP